VTVVGAKYGLDTRETGSSPTYVSITLINQTCAGVLVSATSLRCAQCLVVVLCETAVGKQPLSMGRGGPRAWLAGHGGA
jgi:hypothetical protein